MRVSPYAGRHPISLHRGSFRRGSLRREAFVAALVVTLSPLAAGCGADFNSGTTKIEPRNPNARIGNIKIRNPVVVASADGDRAVLTMAIVNDGASGETLESVEVDGAGKAELSARPVPAGTPGGRGPANAPAGTVVIPAHRAVFVGSTGGPWLALTRRGGKPALGDFVQVTLTFAKAGQLEVEVPVLAPSGPYATLTPSKSPSATPGKRPSGKPPSATPGKPLSNPPTP